MPTEQESGRPGREDLPGRLGTPLILLRIIRCQLHRSVAPAARTTYGLDMAIQYGDLPTWLASIGTVGALGAALWQIRTERTRRLQQEAHDREDARRAQARRVACWPGEEGTPGPMDPWWGKSTPIEVVNGSNEPVYNLVFALVQLQGAGGVRRIEEWEGRIPQGQSAPWSTAAILPPGRWRVSVPGEGWSGGMGMRLGAEIAFVDRAGVNWIRRSSGGLEELPQAPIDYFAQFGLHGPYDLQVPVEPGWSPEPPDNPDT